MVGPHAIDPPQRHGARERVACRELDAFGCKEPEQLAEDELHAGAEPALGLGVSHHARERVRLTAQLLLGVGQEADEERRHEDERRRCDERRQVQRSGPDDPPRVALQQNHLEAKQGGRERLVQAPAVPGREQREDREQLEERAVRSRRERGDDRGPDDVGEVDEVGELGRQAREGPDGVEDHHRRQDVEREQRADQIAVLRRLGRTHVERDEGEHRQVRAGYRQHALDAAAFCLIGNAELRT